VPTATPTSLVDYSPYVHLFDIAENFGTVRVIVGLNVPFNPEGNLDSDREIEYQQETISRMQDTLLENLAEFEISFTKLLTHIPFLALEVNLPALEYLITSPLITTIDEDIPAPPFLAESIPLVGADDAWSSGYSGAGQTIVFLDTGIDKNHPFLLNKVVAEACFSSTTASSTTLCPSGQDEQIGVGAGVNCAENIYGCTHGTHVAGIAIGKRVDQSGSLLSGVAADANAISIQVYSSFNSYAYCGYYRPCVLSWASDQIAALDHIYAIHENYNIAAVNMSLGGSRYSDICDSAYPALKAAIDNLRSVGIATIISSGNEGYSNSVSTPACVSSAISVGATDKYDNVAGYSNSAYFLDLLAPGSFIYSSLPGVNYGTKSGTSMAAPHVSGAWAVLKSNRSGATVADILALLNSTGIPITDARNGITKPRIQVEAALCYTLTTNAEPSDGGSVSVDPAPNCDNGTKYAYGTQVTLTANPISNYYRITSWSGDVAGSNASVDVSMTTDQTITANFEQATFADVPFDHEHWAHIEALWDNGYTAGCSTDPLMFCPDTILSRAMSAVFLLRGHKGTGYTPPTEPWDTFFDDWSSSDINWAEKWAEGMWLEGLTAGCQTNPLKYCPRNELPRVEASVFALNIKYGTDYVPPSPSGTMLYDVTDVNYWGTKWVEQAYRDGLLPACGTQDGQPLYCLDELVNRAWGAYMIVKAKDLPVP